MKKELITSIKDGYSVAAGLVDEKWFAAVLKIKNIDEEFVDGYEEMPQNFGGLHATAVLKPDKSIEDWRERLERVKRRLLLVTEDGEEKEIACADRIGGFAVARKGPEPAVAWSEKIGGEWRALLLTPHKLTCLFTSRKQYWNPSLGWFGEKPIVAYEYWDGNQEMTGVWNGKGKLLFAVPGRSPQLVTDGNNNGLLVIERCTSPDSINLTGVSFNKDGKRTETIIPELNNLNYEASVAYNVDDNSFYITCLACPAWGIDINLGVFRDMGIWKLEDGKQEWLPVSHTKKGSIPQPVTGQLGDIFNNEKQYAPINPRIFFIDGQPAVAYRCHQRTHVWHYTYTVLKEDGWSEPIKLGDIAGEPDPSYSIWQQGLKIKTFFPACDQSGVNERSYTSLRARLAENRFEHIEPSWNYRVEISNHNISKSEIVTEDNDWHVTGCYRPQPVKNIHPDLTKEIHPQGKKLVWMDEHPHCSYSLCTGAINGLARDWFIYQRDVQKCEILTLADHLCRISCPAQFYLFDQLELEAGERCRVVYGSEPSCGPAHNINVYTINRKIFDSIRVAIYQYGDERDRKQMYKNDYPERAVAVIRHFHGVKEGKLTINSAETVKLYDSEIEPAMESMQIRGHRMFCDDNDARKFPNNFLNAGAKIGLVGGSDHSGRKEPLHFCLTGFWVDEFTPEAIWKALWKRQTIAVSNGKTVLWAELEGKPMGSEVLVKGKVNIHVSAHSARKIRKVYLVRDEQILTTHKINDNKVDMNLNDSPQAGYHWYVVNVESESAYEDEVSLAQSSPFFVEVDKN